MSGTTVVLRTSMATKRFQKTHQRQKMSVPHSQYKNEEVALHSVVAPRFKLRARYSIIGFWRKNRQWMIWRKNRQWMIYICRFALSSLYDTWMYLRGSLYGTLYVLICVLHVQHDKSFSASHMIYLWQRNARPHPQVPTLHSWERWRGTPLRKSWFLLAVKFASYRQDEESMLFNHDITSQLLVIWWLLSEICNALQSKFYFRRIQCWKAACSLAFFEQSRPNFLSFKRRKTETKRINIHIWSRVVFKCLSKVW